RHRVLRSARQDCRPGRGAVQEHVSFAAGSGLGQGAQRRPGRRRHGPTYQSRREYAYLAATRTFHRRAPVIVLVDMPPSLRLDDIRSPADLRSRPREELPALADDIRARLVDVCSRTGGHIGAGLGVVELTIALHYAFNTPRDQLIC